MLVTVEEGMGAAEIQRLLGVSRQRVQQIVNRADFPKPGLVLSMGKVWVAAEVRAWVQAHRAVIAEPVEVAPRKRAKRTARELMTTDPTERPRKATGETARDLMSGGRPRKMVAPTHDDPPSA